MSVWTSIKLQWATRDKKERIHDKDPQRDIDALQGMDHNKVRGKGAAGESATSSFNITYYPLRINMADRIDEKLNGSVVRKENALFSEQCHIHRNKEKTS